MGWNVSELKGPCIMAIAFGAAIGFAATGTTTDGSLMLVGSVFFLGSLVGSVDMFFKKDW